jgi:outer membrane protein assembly factor BamB
MLNKHQAVTGVVACAALIVTAHAQVGRGGSEWLTARGDAQRTSWIRTDAKISVESMSKAGFDQQWTRKLDSLGQASSALGPGVSANGVTLFIPMSIVTGSGNNVYALDNDTGYVVWQRHIDAPVAAPSPECPGGVSPSATRIVSLTPAPITLPTPGRAGQAYRSVIGGPGEGAPVEVRGGAQGARGAGGAQGARGAQGAQGAGSAPGTAPQRGAGGFGPPAGPAIPGATPEQLGGGRGGLGRASGVVYAIASDGVLHVMGLPSGKDIQKPAEFFPANARWSDPIAVNTTLYTTTSGGCGGAPNAVWAIDLDSDGKPVVSWTSGGPIVGPIAFTSDGTLIAAIGQSRIGVSGEKPNAMVALDGKTLRLKDWFVASSLSGSEFVTGPTVFRAGDREIVAAATQDGRVVLLDAASLGGADHATPLASASIGSGARFTAGSLATWQEMTITPPPPPPPAAPGTASAPAAPAQPDITLGTRWILAPVGTTVVALKLVDRGGSLTLDPGWTAANLAAPATPVVVNGVVFALATGSPAALHAYDGATGKELWSSGTTLTSAAAPGSFWSAFGQVYVGTTDGVLHAFGFLDERR